LPYRVALLAWALINLAIVIAIARLLEPFTQELRRMTGIPIALYLLAFSPLLYVFGEGQDSLLFLLFVTASLRLNLARRAFPAGFLLALAFFKFHFVLLIAFFVFVLRRDSRGVLGFATGGLLVAATSIAMVGPNLPMDYLSMLRQQEMMTPWGFIPWFMP